MKQYHDLLELVLTKGKPKGDRTGTGTLSVFGAQARFDLREGFPLLTTKLLHTKSIVHELLWFLSGSTNICPLVKKGVTIWNEWADKNGELGPVYGYQWRRWNAAVEGRLYNDPLNKGRDQIAHAIEQIRANPDSRSLIVTAWNPDDIPYLRKYSLPPCHCLFQFYVCDGELSCQLYQRSCDLFLGVPFNIASYALLTHMVAQVCNLRVGDFIHTYGDLHLYNNHLDQARLQLTRDFRPLPTLVLDPTVEEIDGFKFEHINFAGYFPHPAIKAPIAV